MSSGSPTAVARPPRRSASASSTLRRLLPYIETIEMPWGTSLIPADELERVAAERRRTVRPRLKSRLRADANRPSHPRSRSASTTSASPARASGRSPTTSMPNVFRLLTAVTGGGPQPCVPFFSGQREATWRRIGRRGDAARVGSPRLDRAWPAEVRISMQLCLVHIPLTMFLCLRAWT